MAEFFRGWERKVGVLTLVMACLFACVWIRSSYVTDIFECGGLGLVSADGCMTVWVPSYFAWDLSWPNWSIEPYYDIEQGKLDWKWNWLGFRYADIKMFGMTVQYCTFPYWSVVIPPTLISALLLFGQPLTSRTTPFGVKAATRMPLTRDA